MIPTNLILVILLLIVFFLLIGLNSLIIHGFYAATRFEWDKDTVKITYEPEFGEVKYLENGKEITNIKGSYPTCNIFIEEVEIKKDSRFEVKPSEGFVAKNIISIDRKSHIEPGSKMILWWVKYYSNKWFGDFWSKPICDCPICMSSLHSLWIWLPIYIHFPFEHWLLWMHACFILALAGVNLFISKKVDL